MNGPEHYREAEHLADQAAEWMDFDRWPMEVEERLARTANDYSAAQVHATLALAAATAMSGHPSDQHGTCLPPEDARAWDDVAGVPFGRGR